MSMFQDTGKRVSLCEWIVAFVALSVGAQMAMAVVIQAKPADPPQENRPQDDEAREERKTPSEAPREELQPERRPPGPGHRMGPGPREPEQRGEHPGPPPGLWRRMSEPERQRLEGFIEERFPRLYIELERDKEKNPRRAHKRMRRIAPEMLRLMETLEIHPERGTLMIQERRVDMEIRRRAQQYRSAKNEEKRTRLREKIDELCGQAFDYRRKRRALEIRELEVRLEELKQSHAQAAEMRKKLVKQEVRKRLGPPDAPEPPEEAGRPPKRLP